MNLTVASNVQLSLFTADELLRKQEQAKPKQGPRFVPRDYQQRGIDRAFELFSAGSAGVLFRQPTGSGKTVSGALIAQRWCDQGDDYRCIILAHERQLVRQFADEIEDVLGVRPPIEMADERVRGGKIPKIIVASRQTLIDREEECDGEKVSTSRLYKFPSDLNWLVICDECHRWRYGLRSCRHIVDWFAANPKSRRLGLTATPERGDKVTLARLFPDVASDYRLYDASGGPCAVDDGWAVPYEQRFIVVEGVDFKNIREVAKDFDKKELESRLMERETLARLVDPMLDIVGTRRTIIFNPGVDMAKAVAAYINAEAETRRALGQPVTFGEAVSLDGSYPDEARNAVYSRHQSGGFQFLSVCGLCREGYNDPGIQAVAIFRPTKSRALAEQMKGRGCRPLKGVVRSDMTADERRQAIKASAKPNCLIIDLVGVTGMADCVSTAHILAEGKPDVVIERANRNALAKKDQAVDMAEEIRLAEEELEEERRERERKAQQAKEEAEARKAKRLEAERKRREEAERTARLRVDVKYTAREVRQGGGGVVRLSSGLEVPGATDNQLWFLRKNNIPHDPKTLTKNQASRMIGQFKKGVAPQEIARTNRQLPQREEPTREQSKRQLSIDEINLLFLEASHARYERNSR